MAHAGAPSSRRHLLAALAAASILAPTWATVTASPVAAATISVTTTADGGPGSLRDAFETASTNGTHDIIELQPGATYVVCNVLDHNDTGRTLTLDGNGATVRRSCPALDSNLGTIRNNDAELIVRDLTVTGGDGGAFGALVSGGETAELFVDHVTLTGNHAASGAGIWASGYVEVQDSTISGNWAKSYGGGIYTQGLYPDGTTLLVSDSTITDNVAGLGGGIQATYAIERPNVTIVNSNVSGNRAADLGGAGTGNGGGVSAGGPVQLLWSTVSGNRSYAPGAGITSTDLNLFSSTVSHNEAETGSPSGGGGILASGDVQTTFSTIVGNLGWNLRIDSGSDLDAFGTVIGDVGGPSGVNCLFTGTPGTVTSTGYNVEDDDRCGFGAGAGDREDVADLGLLPLADNGGSGPTHHPTASGGLIDAIPASVPACDAVLFGWDQRQVDRPVGDGCEPGAVEYSPDLLPAHPFSDVPPWVDDAVRWISFHGYADGWPDGTYRPNASMTRAQVVRLLYRFAGSPDVAGLPSHGLSDVPPWVEDAVTWAAHDPDGDGPHEPLIAGFRDRTFRPDDPITRAQVVRLLYRYAGSPDVDGLPPHGLGDVPPWVEDAVRWAVNDPSGPALPVMTGYPDDTFRPDVAITRAAVTRALYRFDS